MSALPLRIVVVAVRGWTRVYTLGMPAASAAARRAEIDSDLWEFEHDAAESHRSAALHVLVRLIAGAADDLCWRVDRVTIADTLLLRRTVTLTALASVLLLVLWLAPASIGPERELGGRRQLDKCASAAPAPESTAEFRLNVMKCAGAFFSAPEASTRDVAGRD